eukprot:XP_001701079.1 predicted protein [Chlamydomonas reinhardtii]
MAWNLPALGVLGAQYCAAICTQYVNYKEIVKSILYDLSTGKRLVRSVAAKYGDACNFMTRLLKEPSQDAADLAERMLMSKQLMIQLLQLLADAIRAEPDGHDGSGYSLAHPEPAPCASGRGGG